MKTTITVTGYHGIQDGDLISFNTKENRWWIKMWYFILRKETPLRVISKKVTSVNDEMTFTFK